jgi:phage gpG-like protein
MITANIKIKGTASLEKKVKTMRQGLRKRKGVNRKAVIFVDRWVQKNFEQQGEPTGERWPPLSELTKLRRRVGKKSTKGHKILQDTGDLKTDWKHFWNNSYGLIRSKTPYAIYHDSDKPRSRLPRRQILPDEKHIISGLLKLYGKYVNTVVSR